MDRIDFEKRLCSVVIPDGTPTEEINRKVLPISEAIKKMLPHSLFKYRSCSAEHIDAFKADKIYAASADKFNDPYDTLVRYDIDGISKFLDAFASPAGWELLKCFFSKGIEIPNEYKKALPEEFWESLKSKVLAAADFKSVEGEIENNKQQLVSSISTWFPILSLLGKRFCTMACFSEDIRSILMWSHYADSHKGFALEYDFRPTLKSPLSNVYLYPVIYSNKRYDASEYLMWAFLFLMGIKTPIPDALSSIKAALYKSKLWEYEKEWRMIEAGARNPLQSSTSIIKYRPVAIYYGRWIKDENKKTLHESAVAKGLKEYEMSIDYISPLYEMSYRPCQLAGNVPF